MIKREYDNNADGNIDNYSQYEYDVNGNMVRQLQNTDNDSNGTIDVIFEYQRDVYGRIIDEAKYEIKDGEPKRASHTYDYTYNENGQLVKVTVDRTGNGLTNDDMTYVREYDNYGRMAKETYINPFNSNAGTSSAHFLEFDANNRTIKQYSDVGNNGVDSRDSYQYFEYDLSTGVRTYIESREYDDVTIRYKAWSEYKSDNTLFRTYLDNGGTGVFDRLNYGDHNARWGNSTTDNLTTWNDTQIAKVQGLYTIYMSQTNGTTLTLDAATLAKINPQDNKLRIWGQSDDTLHLSGFEKTGTSGNHTLYKAEVDGTTYTLEIDTAINTDNVIGG